MSDKSEFDIAFALGFAAARSPNLDAASIERLKEGMAQIQALWPVMKQIAATGSAVTADVVQRTEMDSLD